ncbi:MAG: right-handed parallel beta-helix repeat-containing protein [bacterium]
MKIYCKIACSVLVIIGFSCAYQSARAGAAAAIEYYVAASGGDSADGSAARPFKTIEAAKRQLDAIVKNGFEGDVAINIAPGTYRLDAPLVFESGVYGGGKANIVFRGDKSGGVIVSGSLAITNWQPAGKNIWSADVKGVLGEGRAIRNLYKDDKRLTRSRQPNGWQMFNIKAVENQESIVTLKLPIPEKIAPEDKAELIVLQNWSISKTLIDHSDAADAGRLYLTASAGFTEHPALIPKAGMSCFLENSKSFLDSPGEWYLDEKAGTLYYFASEGEDPGAGGLVAPILEKLVVITGDGNESVKNISFENISFRHTDFLLPGKKYSGLQASFYTREERDPIYSEPAAIELSFAENIVFKDCSVAHTGASGIGIGEGARGNRIEGCHLYDIGGNGINVGHRIRHMPVPPPGSPPLTNLSADWEKPELVPRNNDVSRNFVEYCGMVNYGAVGIFMAHSQRTLVSANTVAHMPYTGVSFGFNWSPKETSTRGNAIEYNHIYDVMNVLADGGGIYTLGYEPETTISRNLIHDIHRSKHTFGGAPNNGIFFDEGSAGIFVDLNIIYGLEKSAFPSTTEPVRFNNTKESNMKWGTNYFGIGPKNKKYPKELAEEILDKAAPEDARP